MAKTERVLIAGCGVIGLFTAKLLREKLKTEVVIVSNSSPLLSTSAGAGGLWEPFHCEPTDLVEKWSARTLDYFLQELDGGNKRNLLELMPKYSVRSKETEKNLPDWKDLKGGRFKFKIEDIKDSFIKYYEGYDFYTKVFSYLALIIDSPRYLSFLLEELISDPGVTLKLNYKTFNSVNDLEGCARENGCSIIINALGLGARVVMNDNNMKPARGPLIMFERPSDVNHSISCETGPIGNDEHPAYLITRGKIVVVGGSFELQTDESEVNMRPEEEQRLLKNAEILCPSLKGKKPIKKWVGFRPYRENGIRFDHLKLGRKQDILMINNYGHGGSGWTVCYGAAEATVEKLREFLDQISKL